MDNVTLPQLVAQHIELATAAASGRSAHTIYGGHEHTLRQTLIALTKGQRTGRTREPGRGHPPGPPGTGTPTNRARVPGRGRRRPDDHPQYSTLPRSARDRRRSSHRSEATHRAINTNPRRASGPANSVGRATTGAGRCRPWTSGDPCVRRYRPHGSEPGGAMVVDELRHRSRGVPEDPWEVRGDLAGEP